MSRRKGQAGHTTETLISFIDFLYAVVFGLILEKTFEEFLISNGAATPNEFTAMALVVGVFYILCWDWLHGPLLTLNNPYRRYRRFFIEVAIAFAGYGAAYNATLMRCEFLFYIAVILFLESCNAVSRELVIHCWSSAL
jgi:hypothetical protein